MSRGLNSTYKAKIASGYFKPALYVAAEFDTTLRLWTGLGTSSFNGVNYTGAGDLLKISSVSENSDLGTSGLSITLSGCNSTIVTAIRDQEFQGNTVTVYLNVVNEPSDGGGINAVAASTVFFKGYMDNAIYTQNGDSVTIQLDVINQFARLSRSNVRLYTAEDQRNVRSNDLGLNYIESIAEQKLVWGK